MDDLDYGQLDPGIREVVRWLRAHGFNTEDSGDGISKLPPDHDPLSFHAFGALPFPHVIMRLPAASLLNEADRLLRMLRELGAEVHPVDPPHLAYASAVDVDAGPEDDLDEDTDPEPGWQISIQAAYDPVEPHRCTLLLAGLDDAGYWELVDAASQQRPADA